MGKHLSKAIDKTKDAKGHRLTVEGEDASSADAKKLAEYAKRIVKELPTLEKLAVNKCKLSSIPSELSLLSSLVLLDIQDNNVAALPDELRLPKLKEAFFAKNKLSSMPNALLGCTALEVLDLHGNEIAVSPVSALERRMQTLFDFPELQQLNLSTNRLEALPPIAWPNLRRCLRIWLDGNKLSKFPTQLCTLAWLSALTMSDNLIAAVPEEIGAMTALTELDLGGNLLTDVPLSLRQLTNLKTLDLRRNKLKSLPAAALSSLTHLSRLFLQGNALQTLPPELGRLPLTMLFLEDNQLAAVPHGLFSVTSLTELHLSGNKLTTLPPELGQLGRLTKLHLNNNALTELPGEIRSLTALTVLLLDHNALRNVPPALLEMHVMRLSLNDNPLDAGLMNTIKAKGALTVIKQARSQFTGGSPSPLSSSSPTRSGSPSRSVGPGPPPPYEEWKLAFEAFLAQMNLGRREELLKLSMDQKWILLQQWRGAESAQHLLVKHDSHHGHTHRRSSSVTSSPLPPRPQDPEYFLGLLAGNPEKKDMVDLRVSLSSRPIGWIDTFCAQGGPRLLLQLGNRSSKMEAPTVDDYAIEYEALRCLGQLLRIPSKFKLFMSHPELTSLLALCLSTRNFSNRCTVLAAINSIGSTPQGHRVVLDAFTHYQTTHEYQNRFQILVESLFEADDTREALQLKVNALTLINNLLKDINDLRERFEMRNQFLAMGINDFINDTSHLEALQTEIALFLDATTEDYELVLASKPLGLPFLLRELAQIRVHLEALALMNPDAPVIPAHHVFVMILFASVQIVFLWVDAQTQASTILSAVARPTDNPDSYGLYIPPASTAGPGSPRGHWLQPQGRLSDLKLGETVFCQYKLRPWELAVDLVPSRPLKSVRTEADPNDTVGAVIALLVKRLGLQANHIDEYSLYHPATGAWLEDTSKLLSYTQLQKGAALHLKRKPVPVKVVSNDTSEVMQFDASRKVQDYLVEIAAHLGLSEQLRDYGFLLKRGNLPAIWLQPGNYVDDYKLTEQDTLRFCMTPKQVSIELPNGQRTTGSIDFQGDVIAQILAHAPPDRKYVVYIKEAEQLVTASRASLRVLNSLARATIVLREQAQGIETGVSLWLENPEGNILYEDAAKTQLKAISVNQLILRLTNPDKRDHALEETFFMAYKTLMLPGLFFAKLMERFDPPPTIKAEVVRVLETWLKDCWSDAEPVVGHIEPFVTQTMPREGWQTQSAQLTALLASKRKATSAALPARPKSQPHLTPIIVHPKEADSAASGPSSTTLRLKDMTWLEADDFEVAKQLTLDLFLVYAAVKKTELMNQAWNRPKLQHLAPNLLNLIGRFNSISAAVATAIVQEPQVRNRAKLMAKFISIANHLKNLNNFLYLQALLVGINGASCLRLKWTRARLPSHSQRTLAELDALMTMQCSFKVYREHLAHVQPPCIPYIGVTLSDLTFAEDGNPERLQNLLNWSKVALIQRIIADATKFQSVPYQIQPNIELQFFLNRLPTLAEDKQYELSLQNEPRNAQQQDIK